MKLEQGYFQTLDLIENELDRRFDQEDLTVAAKLLLVDEGESRAEELMIRSKLPASIDTSQPTFITVTSDEAQRLQNEEHVRSCRNIEE